MAPFKTFATDGSESFWQVWYRFYRKRAMFMWAEPDGAIIASFLASAEKVNYFIGTPLPNTRASDWLPVERLEWRSNKQQRVGEVFYFGHRGDIGFVARAVDPATKSWIRKPNKIVSLR